MITGIFITVILNNLALGLVLFLLRPKKPVETVAPEELALSSITDTLPFIEDHDLRQIMKLIISELNAREDAGL